MKISFGDTILAGGIQWGETPMDFKIFGQRTIQIVATVRGSETKAIDRGNLNTHCEFRVRKKHNTNEAAQDYVIRHASELRDLQTDLTIIEEPSETIYHLKNAAIASVESCSNGNISEHFYKIIGGAVTAVPEEL